MSNDDQIEKEKKDDGKKIKTALEDQNTINPNKSRHFYARHYIIHQTGKEKNKNEIKMRKKK